MSLISSISNSKGRFKKKRRVNKANDSGKQKSAKKAAVAAKQKRIEDANERQKSGNGDDLLLMKRLREERESEQGHDEENMLLTSNVPGDASLTQIESGEDQGATAEGSVVVQSVQLGKPKELSLEPDGEASGEVEAPCATDERVDMPPKEDDGFFGDLFKTEMVEEFSPTVALAASLPDVSAQELHNEAKEIKTLLQRRGGIQK